MSSDWLWMTASDLGRGIGTGDISPVALTETYLAAADAHAMQDRIYARMTADRAVVEAEAAERRAKDGARLSLLDGVPISWKDLYDTAGVVTESGSALLKGRTPDQDALVLENATQAGLVCLGKTHQTELAFSGLGVNPVTATPPNVHDPDLAPGGSSSGAGASIAYGLAAAGIGSDTGGSVRIPAVWQDLVGLKTTHGRLPLDRVVPLCPKFDTVGPLARSVEDAAHLFAALGGFPVPDLRDTTLEDTRMAVLETEAMVGLDPAVAAGFQSAVERLKAAGVSVDRIDVPAVAEAASNAVILFAGEAYGVWGKAIEANPEAMFHQIRARFEGGKPYSAPEYVAAWRDLDCQRLIFDEATAGYDAVLAPTCPNLPPNSQRLIEDDAYFLENNMLCLRNTRIASLMGWAALTLPTGVPSTGIMLMGPGGSEERLLRLGSAAEAALA